MILRNAIKCRHCGTVIESKHRHDFQGHECVPDHPIYVDGGLAYLRRVGSRDDWEEASEFDDEKS